MFYPGADCSLPCLIWNIISIPIRLVLILLIGVCLFNAMAIAVISLTFSWVLSAFLMGFTVGPCALAT